MGVSPTYQILSQYYTGQLPDKRVLWSVQQVGLRRLVNHANLLREPLVKRTTSKGSHNISDWPLPRRAGSWGESIPPWRLGSFRGTGFERGQAKMQRQYNCRLPGCTNSHNGSGAACLLGISACPVPPNDPKCLCVADSNQVSARFGNGQLAIRIHFCFGKIQLVDQTVDETSSEGKQERDPAGAFRSQEDATNDLVLVQQVRMLPALVGL